MEDYKLKLDLGKVKIAEELELKIKQRESLSVIDKIENELMGRVNSRKEELLEKVLAKVWHPLVAKVQAIKDNFDKIKGSFAQQKEQVMQKKEQISAALKTNINKYQEGVTSTISNKGSFISQEVMQKNLENFKAKVIEKKQQLQTQFKNRFDKFLQDFHENLSKPK